MSICRRRSLPLAPVATPQSSYVEAHKQSTRSRTSCVSSTSTTVSSTASSSGTTSSTTSGSQSFNLYYIHSDHLNNAQVITDSAQQVVWMADYEPFGKLSQTTSAIKHFSRFPGQYEDEESGLYYNYFRDYDPSIGRYIQSDPIGLLGGINTYGHVAGDPLRWIDPNGLDPIGTIGDVGGALIEDGYDGYSEAVQPRKDALRASRKVPVDDGMTIGQSEYRGPRDAVRHCVLACSLTQRLGRKSAINMLNRHERLGREPDSMDDMNNLMGCYLGENSDPGTCQSECLKNIDSLMTGRDSDGTPLPNPRPIGSSN